MKPIDFILKYAQSVKDACENTGLFPSVCLAQAALETGWGKASIDNNMFGVKASGKPTQYWDGTFKTVTTHEVLNGKSVVMKCRFRAYKSVTDSIKDHNNLLLTLRRYKPVIEAKTAEEQARQLYVCGYATDPKYGQKLISIITTYNLKQFD